MRHHCRRPASRALVIARVEATPYLLTLSQASHHSASLGPSASLTSSCFDDANQEANVHVNADVATGHADVRANAVMADANDDDDDDDDFDDILVEILGVSS